MTPFTPLPNSTVSLSATTASANVRLGGQPITGPFQVRVHNAGTTPVFIRLGADPALTAATTSNAPVAPGVTEVLTINNRDVHAAQFLAAITASGSATLYATSGYGL